MIPALKAAKTAPLSVQAVREGGGWVEVQTEVEHPRGCRPIRNPSRESPRLVRLVLRLLANFGQAPDLLAGLHTFPKQFATPAAQSAITSRSG